MFWRSIPHSLPLEGKLWGNQRGISTFHTSADTGEKGGGQGES